MNHKKYCLRFKFLQHLSLTSRLENILKTSENHVIKPSVVIGFEYIEK